MYVVLSFLLGSVALVLATADLAETRNPGIVIDENHNLLSIPATPPPINIDLSGLNLQSIDANAFANCALTTTLDLSNNSLHELPENVFSPMINLEHLSLAKNELNESATKNAFLGLAQLKSLNISDNPLETTLNEQNFAGLTKSCDIYINRTINFEILTPFAFRNKEDKSDDTPVDNGSTQSPTHQGRQCPQPSTTDIQETLKDVPAPSIDEQARVKVCLQNNIVSSVLEYNATEDLSATGLCSQVKLDLHGPLLKIKGLSIESLEKGWYQIKTLQFNSVYLSYNKIDQITDVLLNDLPENVKHVSLEANQIQRINKGVIVNEHLLGLDLSKNDINVIEADAFAGTRLTHLNLEINSLKDIAFLQSLPTNLLVLNLANNEIDKIPARSFSNQKQLVDLHLGFNQIPELNSESLAGLDSLQVLQLGLVALQRVEPGVFQNLTNLLTLELYGNWITSLDRGVFDGLECLTQLDLTANNLTTFSQDILHGLTDNFDSLNLNFNDIRSLEANSFVGIPKSVLSLQNNEISQIATNAFNLPHLKKLELEKNHITKIETGTTRNLGNLAGEFRLGLSMNPIKRLDNGALAGLPNETYVDLSKTGIELIQAGVFDDA